jgi:hypothetical protein
VNSENFGEIILKELMPILESDLPSTLELYLEEPLSGSDTESERATTCDVHSVFRRHNVSESMSESESVKNFGTTHSVAKGKIDIGCTDNPVKHFDTETEEDIKDIKTKDIMKNKYNTDIDNWYNKLMPDRLDRVVTKNDNVEDSKIVDEKEVEKQDDTEEIEQILEQNEKEVEKPDDTEEDEPINVEVKEKKWSAFKKEVEKQDDTEEDVQSV